MISTERLFFLQEGMIRVRCVAENLGTHSKHTVKVTTENKDWNPFESIQFE